MNTISLWKKRAHIAYVDPDGTWRRLCDDNKADNTRLELPEDYSPCKACEFLQAEGPPVLPDGVLERIHACVDVLKTVADPKVTAAAVWDALRDIKGWRNFRKAIMVLVECCGPLEKQAPLRGANVVLTYNEAFEAAMREVQAEMSVLYALRDS